MSQLFASPDLPQSGPALGSPVGVKAVDATGVLTAPEGTGTGLDAAASDSAPDGVLSDIFDAPAHPHFDSLDYVVPHVAPSRPRPPRSRKGAVAGLAAMSLLLGTAGGVGGAAAWQAWGPSDSAPSATVTLPVSSTTGTVTPQDGSVAAVAQAVLPSVVQIETKTETGASTGSGVIIRADGYILTNNHVVEGSSGTVQVLFSDGHVEDAKVVGTTAYYDLAVVHVERTDLKPLVLGNSSAMLVGDPVIAVGSPLGLDSTVTTGIVSATNRPVTTGKGTASAAYIAAIQTDAAINPGNSGGPLLNMKGEVIGINSAIAALPGATEATGAGSVGLGFAIPSDQARRVAEQLIATGKATVPAIGAQLDATYSGRGVKVGEGLSDGTPGVVAGSPAEKAGIVEGDIIVAIDGTPVADASTAIVRIRSHAPGDKVEFTLDRGGKDVKVTVTLGTLDSLDYGTGTTGGSGSQ